MSDGYNNRKRSLKPLIWLPLAPVGRVLRSYRVQSGNMIVKPSLHRSGSHEHSVIDTFLSAPDLPVMLGHHPNIAGTL